MKTQIALSAIVTALAVMSQAAIAQTTARRPRRRQGRREGRRPAYRRGPVATQPAPRLRPTSKTRASARATPRPRLPRAN